MTNSTQITRSVFLGLGANLGQPRATFSAALERLQAALGPMLAVSSRYRSLALVLPGDKGSYPPFENIVAQFKCSLDAHSILDAIFEIENSLGRDRKTERRWGPRKIDIDILAIDGEKFESTELTIPHNRIFERDFVLVPWAEIAPDFVLNTSKSELRSVSQALKELNASGQPLYVRYNLGAV